jgi:hypothetical protein
VDAMFNGVTSMSNLIGIFCLVTVLSETRKYYLTRTQVGSYCRTLLAGETNVGNCVPLLNK